MNQLAEIDVVTWVGWGGLVFGALLGVFTTLVAQHWTHWQSKQMVAAERRLEAHQKAFEIWWRMATGYHDQDKRRVSLQECQDFWNSNCLYLGKRSRKAFRETMIDVMFYDPTRNQWEIGATGPAGMKQLHANIEGVFKSILADANLPDLHENFSDLKRILKREAKG